MTLFGLGNPGDRYADTRHNIGFLVLDELARRLRVRFRSGSGLALARGSWRSERLLLVKPMLYMNESGVPVAEQLRREPDDFLVICDDFALPFGRLRLRPQGSDGGHNGLASIVYRLGTDRFPRLRVGIGSPPEGMDRADYVLEPFPAEEATRLPELLGKAADACLAVATDGLERAMNRHNSPGEEQCAPEPERTSRGAPTDPASR